MSITINGATNTLTAASGLTVAGNTAVTGTLSASGLLTANGGSPGNPSLATQYQMSVGTDIVLNPSGYGVVVSGSRIVAIDSTGLAVTGLLDLSAASSGQIKFPATQNASADANTLDDYEEGTWTAALTGSTADPTTPVTVTGKYTKIGRKVFVEAAFEAVDLTGATGFLQVTGLPFATSASMNSVAPATVTGHGATAPVTYVPLGSSVLRFIESTTDTYINVTAAAGKTVRTAVTYHV